MPVEQLGLSDPRQIGPFSCQSMNADRERDVKTQDIGREEGRGRSLLALILLPLRRLSFMVCFTSSMQLERKRGLLAVKT